MAIEITNGFRITDVIPNLLRSGLAFDFVATDYVSGSTTWTDRVNGYTANITGSSTTLEKSGSTVLFNGGQWLEFLPSITSSITTEDWQVYAYVGITTAQRTNSSFYLPLFTKGISFAPNWRYAYEGGAAQPGWATINGGYPPGYFTDSLNAYMVGQNSLLALSFTNDTPPSNPVSASVTLNQYTNPIGNTIITDNSYVWPTYFSGSTNEPLMFGKNDVGIISGSVLRLFGYDRILNQSERNKTWIYLQSNS